MKQDPYLAEVFRLPPFVANKGQPNIRDKVVRSKVQDDVNQRPRREILGMKKCLN